MPFCELKWPNGLEGQGQCLLFSIPAAKIPRCIFASNLVILTQINYKLSRGQAENPGILTQNGHNDLASHGQWPPFSIPIESIPGCMFGANLVTLDQIYDELRGQAKFPRILSQNGQNDLTVPGQWPPFTLSPESILWCMFGANLVIPAEICDELSCGQGKVYEQRDRRTDGRTDRRTNAGNDNNPSINILHAHVGVWRIEYFSQCKTTKQIHKTIKSWQILAQRIMVIGQVFAMPLVLVKYCRFFPYSAKIIATLLILSMRQYRRSYPM